MAAIPSTPMRPGELRAVTRPGDKNEIEELTRAFSVYRQTEGGTITHGLATALVDKDGKINKIWRGNAWKPDEVIREIESINNP
jgi:cytochrome oxidase Cu insertion factor (SCO1/SenC/PrrC family)